MTTAHKAMYMVCKPCSYAALRLLFLLTHSTPATLAPALPQTRLALSDLRFLAPAFSYTSMFFPPFRYSHDLLLRVLIFSNHLCKTAHIETPKKKRHSFIFFTSFTFLHSTKHIRVHLFVILFCFSVSHQRVYFMRAFFVIVVVHRSISSSWNSAWLIVGVQ